LSLDRLLTGEGLRQRRPIHKPGLWAVETAARPDDAAQIAEVERHWQMAMQA
jgi:hypothetical protein